MALPKRDSSNFLACARTTACFGLLTLRVAMRIASFLMLIEGLCCILLFLWNEADDRGGIRWGSAAYERALQAASAAMGLASVIMALFAFSAVKELRPSRFKLVARFWLLNLLWSGFWYACVGTGRTPLFVDEPVAKWWPASSLPYMPHMQVVHPAWPHGIPSVCLDVAHIKGRVLDSMKKKSASRSAIVRKIYARLYEYLLDYVLSCQQVMITLSSWCVADLAFRFYAVSLALYYRNVVLHGGDGVTMIGCLHDLDKPVDRQIGRKQMMLQQLKDAFADIDEDGDGRLTLDELVAYLEEGNDMYAGLSRHLTDSYRTTKPAVETQ
eukprot:TRINITY_DN14975_c0_g2_i1.p1 TRINITY_DN14975_c0_g2~~TRINITY_DN14975_c0_g2_i1.p1  ORF type:complete len:326 (+),score=29.67 TRINITY_DN14975_c0_g2_i1:84-1061(+)